MRNEKLPSLPVIVVAPLLSRIVTPRKPKPVAVTTRPLTENCCGRGVEVGFGRGVAVGAGLGVAVGVGFGAAVGFGRGVAVGRGAGVGVGLVSGEEPAAATKLILV